MAGLELLAEEIDGRLHVAVMRKGVLDDLYLDRRKTVAGWASFYLGKVTKIDPKLDAAFVDIGGGVTGFLQAKHVTFAGSDASDARTGIAELLKTGQMVMVQVKSEAKKASEHEHHKLPRLTMKLYVMGQFLIYSPLSSQVTISRKIVNDEILAITSKLKGTGGWILPANADTAKEEDIQFEAKKLLSKWDVIQGSKEALGSTPGLLREGPDALTRALNDYGIHAFEHIYVADKKLLQKAMDWSERHYPALADSKRLRLFKAEKPGQTLFDAHDAHSGMDTLQDARVHLSCGGSIIIEPTQAIVVIDVNQGSAANISVANQEAAFETARQSRLRNLSGAILVDFINMAQKSERFRLMETLENLYAGDSASAQVHGFTRLGIIEITRKRRTATRAEKMADNANE